MALGVCDAKTLLECGSDYDLTLALSLITEKALEYRSALDEALAVKIINKLGESMK